MPPILLNLFRNCFQRPIGHGSTEAIWKLNKKIKGEFNFVIPRKEFERFALMKPENEAVLTVSQYMFLYNYFIDAKVCKEPGPDFEQVRYYFLESSSMFVLKGWVPTVKDFRNKNIPERTLLNNLNRKLHMFKANDKSPVYVKETQACADKNQSESVFCNSKIDSKVENKPRTATVEVFAGPPRVKSTYNWGVINTWSRHMAPESEDHDPVYVHDRLRQANLPSGTNLSPLAMLDKDITNAIEGKSINRDHVLRQPKKSDSMVVSTLDTRDRRARPRAAKGPRTRPIFSNHDS